MLGSSREENKILEQRSPYEKRLEGPHKDTEDLCGDSVTRMVHMGADTATGIILFVAIELETKVLDTVSKSISPLDQALSRN
ncbi:unnamed protein product [Sphenostylis stenocarpa]|uniref:Uncharacterized protein n=1 Tax=Sphenostylis stenocarpa TaxID=92480 RepID=A0AA86VT06_9FABA|nr:unnamed protein product [Sphenostylis stenocarpa]